MNISHDHGRFRGWLAAVALACVLAACGGGGGGGGGGGSGDVGGGVTPAGSGQSTLAPGIYSGPITISGGESSSTWLSVLKPDDEWYGWEFRSSGEVALYSGTLRQSSGTELISSVVAFRNNTTRSGSASLSALSSQGYTAALNLNAQTGAAAVSWLGSASGPVSSRYTTLADLEGSWLGLWRDGPSSSATATIQFNADRSVVFSALNCAQRSDAPSRVTALAGLPAFEIQLNFKSDTNCNRTEAHLQGIAVLRPSSESGKSRRLDLMAILPDGSGISFHADR